MNKKKIVVALGGNALSRDGQADAASQLQVARETAQELVGLIKDGHQLALVHGNGPQVGNIIVKEESINTDKQPTMPIDVCGAMSQGQIGYWLQSQIRNGLIQVGVESPTVVSVVTQVLVDSQDPAFADPTKPIGAFYASEEEAKKAASERNFIVKEDAGRGWRRVVPSPKPQEIIEADFIRQAVESGAVVISTGGGGIPVKYQGQELVGVEAVIDKDFAAEKLAEAIGADVFLILTAVEAVKVNFNQPDERSLQQVTVAEIQQHLDDGQFAPGSMRPKIEAALDFLRFNPNGQVIITNPETAAEAIKGQAGTIISQ